MNPPQVYMCSPSWSYLLKQTFYVYIYSNFCDFIFFSLMLYFLKSNLYSRFSIFAFWYLLSIWYLYEPNLQYPFLSGSEITGLTALSLFGLSFFSTRSPLSPPSPSLLYPTLWISLCVPNGGEHLGNWLLAGSVSLLLTPPFILLATSVSFLPLLFSV